MSNEAVFAFIDATDNDPKLKEQVGAVKGNDAVAGLAARHEFEFTQEEFQPAIQMLQFLHDANRDKSLREGIRNASDDEAVVALGRDLGYEFSVAELAHISIIPEDDGALNDQELEAVAGGAGIDLRDAPGGLRVQLQQSRNKTSTGKSFSEVAGSGLSTAADGVMSAGQLAAPYIPGGSVLSAAMSG